jgi:hypothetical protein
MRLIKSIALGLIALFLCACLPKIDTTGWRLLERREVTFGAQHDIFTIPAEIGQLSRLQVVVRKNDLEMSHIKIVFHNNEIWSPDLGRAAKVELRSYAPAYVIELPNNPSGVRFFDFRYYRLIKAARLAIVELWGK